MLEAEITCFPLGMDHCIEFTRTPIAFGGTLVAPPARSTPSANNCVRSNPSCCRDERLATRHHRIFANVRARSGKYRHDPHRHYLLPPMFLWVGDGNAMRQDVTSGGMRHCLPTIFAFRKFIPRSETCADGIAPQPGSHQHAKPPRLSWPETSSPPEIQINRYKINH